jgi:hypothetical protein
MYPVPHKFLLLAAACVVSSAAFAVVVPTAQAEVSPSLTYKGSEFKPSGIPSIISSFIAGAKHSKQGIISMAFTQAVHDGTMGEEAYIELPEVSKEVSPEMNQEKTPEKTEEEASREVTHENSPETVEETHPAKVDELHHFATEADWLADDEDLHAHVHDGAQV